MKVGDKVYVKDWGKRYSNIYKWVNNEKVSIWKWKTKIPDHSDPTFFNLYHHRPKLTAKGVPYKDGSTILVATIPAYKNYEYTILEAKQVPMEDKIIFLLASNNGCYIQVGDKGLSTMTIEEQEKVKHLETEERLQALAIDNLGKWSIDSDTKKFPKELLKYLYDTDQRTQFGSGMTKAIIKYPYIANEYTINGNAICLGWEQTYNGKGCDLTEKETISWDEMKIKFPENDFKG